MCHLAVIKRCAETKSRARTHIAPEGKRTGNAIMISLRAVVLVAVAGLAVSGCAGGSAGAGGMAGGESCGSVRAKIARLDAKGVQSLVQAQAQGKKLSGQQKADADLYNDLLNQYLGARCHEAPKH